MAIYRAAIGFPIDTVFPRDVQTINPHFAGNDPNALADQLVINLKAIPAIGNLTPFRVKVYDAQKAPPSYPLADRTNGTGFTVAAKPREVALCLSFYSQYNRPSYRGRLYIPGQFIGGTFGARPTGSQMQLAADWHAAFVSGMAAHSQWCVYSRKLDEQLMVTNWFVDDEWDTVRSRGGRPTTRLTGTP